jgi:hypothetical protein
MTSHSLWDQGTQHHHLMNFHSSPPNHQIQIHHINSVVLPVGLHSSLKQQGTPLSMVVSPSILHSSPQIKGPVDFHLSLKRQGTPLSMVVSPSILHSSPQIRGPVDFHLSLKQQGTPLSMVVSPSILHSSLQICRIRGLVDFHSSLRQGIQCLLKNHNDFMHILIFVFQGIIMFVFGHG